MRNGLARKTMLTAAFLSLLPAAGWAFPGGERGPKGPPPEAYAACEGKKAGDTVEFKNRRGEAVSAVCTEIEGRLVALPAGGPAGGRPGMKGDFRKEGRMDGSRRLERMATVLDLTEEQKTKIRTIFEAEREKAAPLREKMEAHRAKLRQALHAEGDEAVIRALAAEGATLKADLLVSRARTWKEVREILTPAQQAKARQLAELGGKRKEGGCRNR